MKHTLFIVPVRTGAAGTLALCTGRLPSGERTGLAFTSEASLLLTMGPSQRWIRLDEHALRDMLFPLGVARVRVDPHPIGELGRRPEFTPDDARWRERTPATGSGDATDHALHGDVVAPATTLVTGVSSPGDR